MPLGRAPTPDLTQASREARFGGIAIIPTRAQGISCKPWIDDIKISLYPYLVTMILPLADRFQALADPTRLRILALLRIMELSVGELAQVLGQSQPRVSRHLKILADAGVLERRKEGSWVFLTLVGPERVDALFALIDEWADPATRASFTADKARTRLHPCRAGGGGDALFRRARRSLGPDPLAARGGERGRARHR